MRRSVRSRLRRLACCTFAVAFAALGYAPLAFGQGVGVGAGPVGVTIAADTGPTPTVDVTVDVTTPPVASAIPRKSDVAIGVRDGAPPSRPAPPAGSPSGERSSVNSERPSSAASRSVRNAHAPQAQAPRSASRVRAVRSVSMPRRSAAGPKRSGAQSPRFPLARPSGLSGSTSDPPGGVPTLLFFLAAALAALARPGVLRKAWLRLAAPRPSPSLFVLERPG